MRYRKVDTFFSSDYLRIEPSEHTKRLFFNGRVGGLEGAVKSCPMRVMLSFIQLDKLQPTQMTLK